MAFNNDDAEEYRQQLEDQCQEVGRNKKVRGIFKELRRVVDSNREVGTAVSATCGSSIYVEQINAAWAGSGQNWRSSGSKARGSPWPF